MPELPIWEVQARLSEIVDRAANLDEETIIVKDGEPKAVVMSAKGLEGLKRTLDLLSDDKQRYDMRQADQHPGSTPAAAVWAEIFETEPPWVTDPPAMPEESDDPPTAQAPTVVDAAEAVNRLDVSGAGAGYLSSGSVERHSGVGPYESAMDWEFGSTHIYPKLVENEDQLPHSIVSDYIRSEVHYLRLRHVWLVWYNERIGQALQVRRQCESLYLRMDGVTHRAERAGAFGRKIRSTEMLVDIAQMWVLAQIAEDEDSATVSDGTYAVMQLHDQCRQRLADLRGRNRLQTRWQATIDFGPLLPPQRARTSPPRVARQFPTRARLSDEGVSPFVRERRDSDG